MGIDAVRNIFIWGNHSSTQYPDARNGTVKKGSEEIKMVEAIPDQVDKIVLMDNSLLKMTYK